MDHGPRVNWDFPVCSTAIHRHRQFPYPYLCVCVSNKLQNQRLESVTMHSDIMLVLLLVVPMVVREASEKKSARDCTNMTQSKYPSQQRCEYPTVRLFRTTNHFQNIFVLPCVASRAKYRFPKESGADKDDQRGRV